MSDQLPSPSPCQDPLDSLSPLVLPSRLDGQRHNQALREAVHFLRLARDHHPGLEQRQLLDRALLRLTYCLMHLDARSDCLEEWMQLHAESLARLQIQLFHPLQSV